MELCLLFIFFIGTSMLYEWSAVIRIGLGRWVLIFHCVACAAGEECMIPRVAEMRERCEDEKGRGW